MCNYSQVCFDEGHYAGIEEGIVIGKEEGIAIGIEETQISMIKALSLTMSVEEICDKLSTIYTSDQIKYIFEKIKT